MVRWFVFVVVLLSACARDADPCAQGCISTVVEWEEGFGPASGARP